MMSFFDDGSHPHKMATYSIKSGHQKIIGATKRKRPSNSRIGRADIWLRLMSATPFLHGIIEPCFQRWGSDGDFTVDNIPDQQCLGPSMLSNMNRPWFSTSVLTALLEFSVDKNTVEIAQISLVLTSYLAR
jgi:hypothetical protein